MITYLKHWLGWGQRPVRHCRDCGAVVPAGDGVCPRCHGMDFDDGRRDTYQEGARESSLSKP
jgi:hypothetical protein